MEEVLANCEVNSIMEPTEVVSPQTMGENEFPLSLDSMGDLIQSNQNYSDQVRRYFNNFNHAVKLECLYAHTKKKSLHNYFYVQTHQ